MSRGLTRGYDPSLIYNLIPNPWADDGGNPPTLPPGFAVQSFGGITPQYLGRGVRDGIPYTSWRVSSAQPTTDSLRGHISLNEPVVGTIPASSGDVFTLGLLVEITRIGSTTSPGLPKLCLSMQGINIDFTAVTESYSNLPLPTTRTFADGVSTITRTITNSSTAWLRSRLLIDSGAAGLTHDYDFDIGFPVLNRGATPLTDIVPLGKLIERRHGTPTYGLVGALGASLDETVVRALAIALDFPSGIARWNSSPTDIVIDGETFFGVGVLGSISAAEEGTELRSYGMTVGISGIPSDAIALALGQAYQGRPGTVWEVMLDRETWQPVADPVVIFRGRMDQMNITLGRTAEVQVSLENRLTDWERPKIKRYTDSEQRRRDPNDGSFRFLPTTTEKEIIWPARSFFR